MDGEVWDGWSGNSRENNADQTPQGQRVVVFVLFVLTYSVVGLGLVALAAHVSRIGDRVLAALEGLRHA